MVRVRIRGAVRAARLPLCFSVCHFGDGSASRGAADVAGDFAAPKAEEEKEEEEEEAGDLAAAAAEGVRTEGTGAGAGLQAP